MIITLPWPPKELSPNARVHWARGITSRDIAAGRNRAGVRETGCAAPTPWTSQENSADSRETDTAGCF